MVRFVTFLSLFTLTTAVVNAQVDSRWQFGAKAGVSISTHDASGDWPHDTDHRTGLDVGAFVSWRFAFPTALLMEVHYVQNGHKGIEGWDPETSEGPPAPADFRIDYVSVPVLLRIDMPVGELPTYLLLGPHFNFKVGQDEVVGKYYADSLESFVFGGTVGFGHQWQLGARLSVMGEFTYRHDFTEAFDIQGTKLSNRAFGLLVGVKFD